MKTQTICQHRWRYFVNVETRAVRVRQCEYCGRRMLVPSKLEPLPARRPESALRSA